MENPEIFGVQYQQGTLAGYEAKEYLLEKWGRKCAYCGAENTPLQIEHIQARSNGGSDRISNLTLACAKCNAAKGNKELNVYLKDKPDLAKKILTQTKRPLKNVAAVNATRWAILNSLKDFGLPVSAWSGGRTKYNRTRLGLPKTHAFDALCVGDVDSVAGVNMQVLRIKAVGRGRYLRTLVNSFGFPRGYCMRQKQVNGFQTGDIVKVDNPKGKYAGKYTGRVAVRKSGYFDVKTTDGIKTVSWSYCQIVQRGDGYEYSRVEKKQPPIPSLVKPRGFLGEIL
jgi:hypothetical protein